VRDPGQPVPVQIAPRSRGGPIYDADDVSSGFSTHEITRMLGLSPARVRAYVKAGLLCPQRGQAGELRFSFQDLLLLRTAEGLVTERLPPRRVRDALKKLRQRLPTERPLTGVQLDSDGDQVVVRDGDTAWQADSGQVLLAFDAPKSGAPDSRDVRSLVDARRASEAETEAASQDGLRGPDWGPTVARPGDGSTIAPAAADPTTAEARPNDGGIVSGGPEPSPSADSFYQLGCSLEDAAPEAARSAYQRAISLDPRHTDAHVNLGRLMHESGDLMFAEEHYREALALRPKDTTALFNLGVVLEDRGRGDAALEMYEATIAIEPANADAHFNAARLHELAGRYEAAVRHLRAYRDLTHR